MGLVDCGGGVRLERAEACQLSDGITLVSDHYYPQRPGPNPTILMRQPYGRDIASTVVFAHPVWFARHGYNVGRDGAETIAWLRTHAESDGRIGIYGFSYHGTTQLWRQSSNSRRKSSTLRP